jgi:hypothetical protein
MHVFVVYWLLPGLERILDVALRMGEARTSVKTRR